MKSQDQITLRITRREQGTAESACFVYSDYIVGVLGESPESTKAVRDGNVATVTQNTPNV